MRTKDLDEAVEAVTAIYCSHRIHVGGRSGTLDVSLNLIPAASHPMVQLSYGTPVRIDTVPRLYLMMHGTQGAARARQGGLFAEWRARQTVPFSAGIDTQLWFDGSFVSCGMRLDIDKLESLCARWLGHPLTQPLRLALQPLSPEFEVVWQRTLDYIRSFDNDKTQLAGASKAALDEYLLTLLLHHHPHNYSDELSDPVPTPVPGVVRRAERYIADHADTPMTVSDVADAIGVSLRSLQQGFRQWRSTTPMIYLREIRMKRVREELLRKDNEETVSEIALRYGFSHLGRFSAYYRSMFGEAPSVTWRRAKRFVGKKSQRLATILAFAFPALLLFEQECLI